MPRPTDSSQTAPGRLSPGDVAPGFELPDDTGKTVRLADFAGSRVLLYAYPAAMTPGCTTQSCDFRDSLQALNAAGIQVVGISPDSPAKLAKFREKHNLTFPLVADPAKAVLTAYGAYGEKSMYGKKMMGVIRSTFLIGADGRIEMAQYNVKATGHVARLRKELRIDG